LIGFLAFFGALGDNMSILLMTFIFGFCCLLSGISYNDEKTAFIKLVEEGRRDLAEREKNRKYDKEFCTDLGGEVIKKDDEEFCEYKIHIDGEDDEIKESNRSFCLDNNGKIIKKNDEEICEFKIDKDDKKDK
jgi:hypothetical protein